ncbi:MAG: hypothetical protein ACJ76P_05740 [Actinomycetota bacterium]
MRRIALLALIAVAAVPALAGSAAASTGDGIGSRVVLLGGLDVPEGKTVEDVFVLRGPVTIDGTATGNVLSVDGHVTVSGHIEGNLIAVNGPVELKDGAEVDGDVSSRLTPTIAPGATVKGAVKGVNVDFQFGNVFAARFVFWLAASISLLVLGLLLLAFVPRAAAATVETMRESTGAAIGFGFVVFIGLPVVAVLALVTLVGIPLGLGILLALVPLYSVGYVTTVWLLGRRIVRAPASPYLAFLVGWAILRVLALVPALGGILWFLASVFGLGVLAVTARRAGRPAVPPPPSSEPMAMPPAPV